MLLAKEPKRQRKNREFEERDKRSNTDKGQQRRSKQHHQDSDVAMQLYRIEVGHNNKVQPGNIVGAIANETGLDGQLIRKIKIHDDYSTVELPDGMPRTMLKDLKKIWVCGKQLDITVNGEKNSAPAKIDSAQSKPRKRKPKK